MDVLSLRKTSGEVSGDIRVNGYPQEPDSFRRITVSKRICLCFEFSSFVRPSLYMSNAFLRISGIRGAI